MKEGVMKNNSLTPEQIEELKALASMPDESIDFSDIPKLTDEFWKKGIKNPFYRPHKQATTVRIDVDVLAWLKAKGKGYQTKINTILREAMIEEITHEKEVI
jgi:uncharacterized protein (DUF4415 family)